MNVPWIASVLLLVVAQAKTPEQTTPQPPPVLAHKIDVAKPPAAFTQLHAELRKAKVIRASFSEEKRIVGLKRPLSSSGELVFSGERGLYRETTAPRRVELIVTRKGIEQRTAAGVERFDLEKQPVARVFVDAFLLVFSGDEAALGAQFDLYFQGSSEAWSMGLVPRKEPLSKLIAHIVVDGVGAEIRAMSVVETGGGITNTTWRDVVLGKALSEEEERRLFGARE